MQHSVQMLDLGQPSRDGGADAATSEPILTKSVLSFGVLVTGICRPVRRADAPRGQGAGKKLETKIDHNSGWKSQTPADPRRVQHAFGHRNLRETDCRACRHGGGNAAVSGEEIRDKKFKYFRRRCHGNVFALHIVADRS
jgi:hypothetical protein